MFNKGSTRSWNVVDVGNDGSWPDIFMKLQQKKESARLVVVRWKEGSKLALSDEAAVQLRRNILSFLFVLWWMSSSVLSPRSIWCH